MFKSRVLTTQRNQSGRSTATTVIAVVVALVGLVGGAFAIYKVTQTQDEWGALPSKVTTDASTTTTRPASSTSAASASRPNVLIILLDDATYREMPLMPKLQSLIAAPGTTFPNYFDSTPICCPARAGILSGQYNHNNRVPDNFSASEFAHNNQLASWLDGAGYQTSLLGKYLNEFPCVDGPQIPKGWDDWQQVCRPNDGQYDYTLNDNGSKITYGSAPRDYMVDVLRRRMVKTLDEFSVTGDPFFVYVAPTVPHAPEDVPPRYKNTPVPTYPAPAAFNEADMTDKPWLKGVKKVPKRWREFYARAEVPRLRMNLAVDDMVEAAVHTLKARGELDNTVIMVFNDNGLMRGEHRLAFGKGLPYYESVNSGPLYVRGPGFPAGSVNSALVGNIDIAPTITALADATAKRVMDGVNILPAVKDPASFADRALYHYLPQWGKVSGVRVGDRIAYFKFGPCCYDELYDYQSDPDHTEMNNLSSDPAYFLLKPGLIALTEKLSECRGRACALTFDAQGRVGRLGR